MEEIKVVEQSALAGMSWRKRVLKHMLAFVVGVVAGALVYGGYSQLPLSGQEWTAFKDSFLIGGVISAVVMLALVILGVPLGIFFRKIGRVNWWVVLAVCLPLCTWAAIVVASPIEGASPQVTMSGSWQEILQFFLVFMTCCIFYAYLVALPVYGDSMDHANPSRREKSGISIIAIIAVLAVFEFNGISLISLNNNADNLRVNGETIESYRLSVSEIKQKLTDEKRAEFEAALEVIDFALKDSAHIEAKDKTPNEIIAGRGGVEKLYVDVFNLSILNRMPKFVETNHVIGERWSVLVSKWNAYAEGLKRDQADVLKAEQLLPRVSELEVNIKRNLVTYETDYERMKGYQVKSFEEARSPAAQEVSDLFDRHLASMESDIASINSLLSEIEAGPQ